MPSKHASVRGFSLVELLVTLAISTIIVGGVLIRFNAFDSVVVLKSIAYEVALTIREAQVFAVSATGNQAMTSQFDQPYGVHFDLANPQQYILYENAAGTLEYGSGDTIIETFTMNQKYEINDICVTPASGGESCTATTLSVAFQRPEFRAYIFPGTDPVQSRVTFTMVDDPSTTFSVVVGVTGNITVESP